MSTVHIIIIPHIIIVDVPIPTIIIQIQKMT